VNEVLGKWSAAGKLRTQRGVIWLRDSQACYRSGFEGMFSQTFRS
jgi:hypothetical protein